MTERVLSVSVKLKADGSGLIGQTRLAMAEVAALGTAAAAASQDAEKLATANAAAATSAGGLATSVERAATSTREAGAAAQSAASGGQALASGLGAAAAAAQALAGDTRQAAASAASVGSSASGAAGDVRQLGGALGTAAASASSYTSDLARLRAELDPAGEAQRRMAQAVDLASTAFQRGDLSADEYAAALKRAEGIGRGQISSAGQQRNSMIQLGQQFQDFTVQVGSGQSITTAFAQQIGQAAFAVQGMGGKMAGVAAFLGGPWGIGLTIALVALAPLVGKLFEGGAASDELKDKSLSLEDALGDLRAGTDAARKALEDYNAEKDKAAAKDTLATQNALGLARSNLAEALSTRERTKALLERVGTVENPNDPLEQQRVGATQVYASRIAAQDAQIAELRRTLGNLAIDFAKDTAKLAADPVAALNREYDELADRATRAARANAGFADSIAAQSKLTADLAAIEAKRAAALKTQQDQQRKAAADEQANTKAGTLTPFLSPVTGGRITGVFGEQRSDHTHAGVDYAVPVGTPVRAPASGTIDVAGARQGYGNAIYINFGGGTSGRFGHLSKFNVKPGDVVDAGDVIGYSGGAAGAPGSGDSTGAHLHYELRQNGRAIDPTKGAYRTDAGQAGDDAQRLADSAARKAETLDRQVQAAKKSLEAFGEQAGGQIARVSAEFGIQETAIRRAELATQGLDQTIADLAERKPPGFEQLIAQAQDAKAVIADSIDRPIRDFVEQQQQSFQIGQLQLAGQEDQADALRTILSIERERGPLSEAQKDAILATTQALRAQGQEIERNRARQQIYLGAVDDVRRIVTDTIYEGPGSLKDLPGKLFDSFKKFNAELITENLFGDTFRKLKAEITGTDQVGDASARMAQAVDQVSGKYRLTGDALDVLAAKARDTAASLGGSPAPGIPAAVPLSGGPDTIGAGAVPGLFTAFAPTLGALSGAASDLADAALPQSGGLVDPNPGRSASEAIDAILHGGTVFHGPFDQLGPQIGTLASASKELAAIGEDLRATPPTTPAAQPGKRVSASDAYGHQITELIKKVGIGPDTAADIGKFAGKGLAGAFEGQAAAGFASLLGIKTDATGAALGGGLGGILGGVKSISSALGPFGAALAPVLGIVGGLLGGLFTKPKYGTASVTSADGASATAGSNGEYIGQAAGLAGSVQDGLHQITDQLGGMLGDFSVAIGSFDGKYRVNTSATTAALNYNNFSASTLTNFGDDQGAAISFAIADAIKDGAIEGISQAQKLALQSSDDLTKAVTEAIKVGQLELDLSGVQGQIDKLFKDFDRTAAERVDLAKKYGLDLLAVEKLNADQRADLLEKALADRVGSLKDLLSNLQYGDLFEGSASERRSAILGEIADAKDDADAGVAGAADRLAALYRQLVETSKDAFGTAGSEYADDRDAAIAGLEKIVQLETDRVTAASTVDPTPAIEAGNTLTGETNDLLEQLGGLTAEQTAVLEQLLARLGGGGGSGPAPNLQLVMS